MEVFFALGGQLGGFFGIFAKKGRKFLEILKKGMTNRLVEKGSDLTTDHTDETDRKGCKRCEIRNRLHF
jgi:hypothetical protein